MPNSTATGRFAHDGGNREKDQDSGSENEHGSALGLTADQGSLDLCLSQFIIAPFIALLQTSLPVASTLAGVSESPSLPVPPPLCHQLLKFNPRLFFHHLPPEFNLHLLFKVFHHLSQCLFHCHSPQRYQLQHILLLLLMIPHYLLSPQDNLFLLAKGSNRLLQTSTIKAP